MNEIKVTGRIFILSMWEKAMSAASHGFITENAFLYLFRGG